MPGLPIQALRLSKPVTETLQQLGVLKIGQLMQLPRHDLTARFDLSDELVCRMQGQGVLYDHEGGADFFQAYSLSFGGSLFIEIVQRNQGYTGYGATNAPFRIAAQKRLSRVKGVPRR